MVASEKLMSILKWLEVLMSEHVEMMAVCGNFLGIVR
ncbi:hypothetical protein X970_17055 [Pseudomonas monteilii SB3101]|uniref:Uncharacterized protein n=1 Tax=Pseudomonas monteilii SB3101 TaxID=1435058 RepID=V9V8A4_9PSED|nr:hypothetical protein X969_17410 [Pseudomonas monteilii SB3078]AHC91146.1 hypothetical protein X970_17055 [Pseudomonas monteilii SB3101]